MGKHLIWQSQNNDSAKLWLRCVCLLPPSIERRGAGGDSEQRTVRGQRRDVDSPLYKLGIPHCVTACLQPSSSPILLPRGHFEVKLLSHFQNKPWLWRIIRHSSYFTIKVSERFFFFFKYYHEKFPTPETSWNWTSAVAQRGQHLLQVCPLEGQKGSTKKQTSVYIYFF